MAFNSGLSGIRAASTDLEVTGNNVANASTIGFKGSRVEFADLYTTTLMGTGMAPVGSGLMVDNIRQKFSQGNVSGTESALDLAIDGNGFFILNDRGTVSYTRAGMLGLDKEGYVVANSGGRLQGYDANESGLVSGVLGDIQIEVSNQPPRLTSLVRAVVNVDASETVLQENGLQLLSTGLAIGVADSGIISSTASQLSSVAQPTTSGTPASVTFASDLSLVAAAGYGALNIDFDIGDGTGNRTIALAGVSAGSSVQDVINDVQLALDSELGTQQMKVSQSLVGGVLGGLMIERDGINATNGTSFALTNTAPWESAFGVVGAVVTGTQGDNLFVGNNPISADFRSIPGTSTTLRTTSSVPLNIVASDAGEFAVLTASTNYSSIDISTSSGNSLAFSVVTESGANYPIVLSQAGWTGTPPLNYASPTEAEIVAEINAQITAAAGAGNEEVLVVSNLGKLEFRVQAPAGRGDFVQVADNGAGSTNYSLLNLGLQPDNRFNGGVEPVLANNEFNLQVNSTTGNGAGPFTITIPPANYANLESIANEIQKQIDIYIGASGLAGKVSVEEVGGQLVFTNNIVGAGESLSITSTAAEPQSVTALGLIDMFSVSGQDEIDRTNSFRINLTVPAPDDDGRSGSVIIGLDEEFKSVQQLASAINRQLNSQDAENYIGVQASAEEVQPRKVPPEFQLKLTAIDEGEASVISISNVTASGDDVSAADMFSLLQIDPTNLNLFEPGIAGVTNKYPEQTITLEKPDGSFQMVTVAANSEANDIVTQFNQLSGVTASAASSARITASGFNSPSGNLRITLNDQPLVSASLAELVTEINDYQTTTLPGFSAALDENGDLLIDNEIGRDIRLEISSTEPSDSMVVIGGEGTGPVVLGGTTGADSAAAIGGQITFIFNEGYKFTNPQPAVSGIFGTLTNGEYTDFILNSFDPTDQDTYNHATSTTIYDSLGNPHVMTQFFVKEPQYSSARSLNEWAMYVQIDGYDVGDPDPSLAFPENLQPTRARYSLFFNPDGMLNEQATGDIFITNWDPRDEVGLENGALTSKNVLEGGLPLSDPPTSSNFQLDLAGSMQFGSAFAVNEVNQNGYTTGRLTGLEVDLSGVIFARFTNGQAQTLGQVALANFRNPEGLTPVGDTAFGESFESGVATIGSPRTASFGQIRSSSLEDSNVDLSEQLVGLIIAQRNFQASAKTIETTDQVTQAILNI